MEDNLRPDRIRNLTATVDPYPQTDTQTPNPQQLTRCFYILRALVDAQLALLGFMIMAISEFSSLYKGDPTIFQVSSLSLSNFNTSVFPSLIMGTWDVQFMVHNPIGKSTYHYENINAYVSYKDMLIVQTTLPSFDLTPKKNQTVVSGRLVTAGANISTWVVNDISKDRANGSVRFNLELEALVVSDQDRVMVFCKSLEMGLTEASGNASLVDKGGKYCDVR